MDEIKPTPRSGALGTLADALKWAQDQGNKVPLVAPGSTLANVFGGPGGLGSLLLGKSPEEVERWAYGNAPMRMPDPGTGGYVPDFKRTLAVDDAGNRVPGNQRTNRAESVLDAVLAAQPALPLAKAAGRTVGRGAEVLAAKAAPSTAELAITTPEAVAAANAHPLHQWAVESLPGYAEGGSVAPAGSKKAALLSRFR